MKLPAPFHNSGKNGLLLGAFTLLATFLISLVNILTEPRIAEQYRLKTLQTVNDIVPVNSYNNDLAQNCVLVSDPRIGSRPQKLYRAYWDGQLRAFALEATTPNGYSGNIDFIVSVKAADMTIGGVRVLAHQETPGLGDKIDLRVDDWILGFSGEATSNSQTGNWAVKKDGGQFDQFTGATITPRAVVSGVQQALAFLEENWQELQSMPANCQTQDP